MNELKGKRVLFFVPENNVEINAIYSSQVGALAKYAASLGAECLVFQAGTLDSARSYDLAPGVHVLNDLSLRRRVVFFKVSGLYRELAKEHEKELAGFCPTHIYTRNHYVCRGALELAKITGAKLIFSVRGPAAEERINCGGLKNWIVGHVERFIEDSAIRNCDVLSTLSHQYEKYLGETYRRNVTGVIPCCVAERFFEPISAERRDILRAELGFSNEDRVIVWSGSFAHWQRLDDVIEFVKTICEQDNRYRVLFLVNKVDPIKALCAKKNFGKKWWRIKSCLSSEMPEHLQLANIGINFQWPSTLHSRTCSPIKVPEYLASGLPVIVTHVMGDLPDLICREGVGYVLTVDRPLENPCEILDQLIRISPEKARDCARRHFTWTGNKGEVVRLFGGAIMGK